MIEKYFTKYDQAIYPTLSSNCVKEKKNVSITNQRTLPTTENIVNEKTITTNPNVLYPSSTDELRGLYFTEKKKNLQLRHENSSLKQQISNLQSIIYDKDNEIKKMKIETQKDSSYLINLEKMVTTLKSKLRSIKKDNNNNHNKSKRIEDKEQLSQNNNDNNNNATNDQLILQNQLEQNYQDLIEEVIKLRQFKSDIITLSKQNELINLNIFTCLQKIETLFLSLEQIYKESNVNIPLHEDFYQLKYANLNEIKENYDKIMSSIMDSLNAKQEEYLYLINLKENENLLLVNQIEEIKRERDILLNDNVEKDKIINTIKVENEFIKMRDQYNFDEKIRKEENIKRKILEVSSSKRANMKIDDMRNSVNHSVRKIKRNFDITDANNNDFINNFNLLME